MVEHAEERHTSVSVAQRALQSLATAACVLLLGSACLGDDGDWKRFSVEPRSSQRQRSQFADAGTVTLSRVLAIGSLDGPEEYTFSGISDVDLGPDGSIYVVDPNAHHVAVYDGKGSFRRAIGRAGAGPGEFVAPSEIALVGDSLAVFDQALLRVSIFTNQGDYVRAFPLRLPRLETMSADPSGGLAVTHASRTSALKRITLEGRELPTPSLSAAADSLMPPNQMQNPGVACASNGRNELLYANSWIQELVALSDQGRVKWAKYWPNEVLTSMPSSQGQINAESPRGLVLGMGCSDSHAILGYLDRGTRRIYYDVFTASGAPIARMSFSATDTASYPGMIGSLRGDHLVTARNRPFPQVFVFRILGLSGSLRDGG